MEMGQSSRTVLSGRWGPGWPRRCRSLGGTPMLVPDGPSWSSVLTAAAEQAHGDLVVLPNDMETLEIARHLATELRRYGRRVAVIPTVAQVQGLAAMAVHEPTADFDSVVVTMSSAAGHARHGSGHRRGEPSDDHGRSLRGRRRAGRGGGRLHRDRERCRRGRLAGSCSGCSSTGGELVTVIAGEPARSDDLVERLTRRVLAASPEGSMSRCWTEDSRAI